jgi:hypothetical protein
VSVEVGSAYVTLIPSAKGFASKMQSELGGEVATLGSKGGEEYSKGFGARAKSGIAGAAKGMFAPLIGAAAGLFAFDKAKDFLKDTVAEARNASVVTARTANVMQRMGDDAWTSAEDIEKLTTSLADKSGMDDETVRSGENLLLTFGNIRDEAGKGNKIFDQTAGLMVDMSKAMGSNVKGAAIQLGKALNDPVRGVTALTRVGVSFTQGQKDQIKALVDSGKTLQAQKIVLGEVKKEFGGAAAAMTTPAQRAGVEWGRLKVLLGSLLLPVINKVENVLATKVIPAVTQFVTQMQSGTGAGGRFAADLKSIGSALANVAGFLNRHRVAVIAVVAGYAAYRAILVATAAAQRIQTAVESVSTTVKAANNAVQAIGNSYLANWLGVKALELAAWVRSTAATVASTTALVASTVAQKAAALASKAWAAAQWLLNAAMDANPISLVVVAIAALVAAFVIAYKKSATFRAIVQGAFNGVKDAARALGSAAVSVFNGIRSALGKVGAAAGTVKNTIVGAFNDVWNSIKGFPAKVASLGGKMLSAGKNLASNVVNGIKTIGGDAGDIAKSIVNDIIGFLNNILPHHIGINKGPIHIDVPLFPNLPLLATGGRATGGTLAVIGEGSEPETVMPDSLLGGFLERMTAAAVGSLPVAAGGGGAGSVALTITNWDEGVGFIEDVAGGVVDDARQMDRQTGRAK